MILTTSYGVGTNITRHTETDGFFYYEATFTNGNLLAFSIAELVQQLSNIGITLN